jgi:hypothetical protein
MRTKKALNHSHISNAMRGLKNNAELEEKKMNQISRTVERSDS